MNETMRSSLSDWYDKVEYFDWNGNQITYRALKSNRPWLLLIHGFPTASFDWWKIWNQLSEQFSLIALDMIGFGYSDKPRNFPYSIQKQADLVQDLLKSKGICECHILAHDYGDTVAQELMARYIDGDCFEIKKVCLLNGGIFPESHHPLLIQKLLMSPIGFILSRMLNERKFANSFGRIFGANTQLTEQELSEYWKLVSHKKGHRIAHLIIRYMRERVVNRERWVWALQNFPNKLGLINGPVDPISGQVMVDRYVEVITTENIWLLDGIGHYPQVEAPERLLECFYEFIED
jgi:pimeloyl-ACP methyl ester carboxylesterase